MGGQPPGRQSRAEWVLLVAQVADDTDIEAPLGRAPRARQGQCRLADDVKFFSERHRQRLADQVVQADQSIRHCHDAQRPFRVGLQECVDVGSAQADHQRPVRLAVSVALDRGGAAPDMNSQHQIRCLAMVVDIKAHAVARRPQQPGPAQSRRPVAVLRLFYSRRD